MPLIYGPHVVGSLCTVLWTVVDHELGPRVHVPVVHMDQGVDQECCVNMEKFH
jgi:hypothetical protein